MLKNHLKLLTYRFRHRHMKGNRRVLIGMILVILLPVYFFMLTAELFHAWNGLDQARQVLIFNAMGSVLWGLFFFLFLSGIPVTMHFYFLSRDLDLLLSSPIKQTTVFRFKFFITTLGNSMIFYIIGLPILLAAGFSLRLSYFYYLAVIVGGIAFLFIPTGLATLFSLLLIRISTAQKLKNYSVVITGLIFIALWTGIQLIRLERFNPMSGRFDANSLEYIPSLVDNSSLSIWPSHWLCRGLYGFAGGGFYMAAFHFLLLLVSAAAIFYFSALFIQKAFEKGITKTVVNSVKNSKSTGRIRRKTPVIALAVRDYKLLVRDSRLLTTIFFYIAMMVVFPLVLGFSPPLSETPLPQPYIKMLLFCSIMAGSLAARLIPMEGLSFFYNRFLPMPARIFMISKTLLCSFFCICCTVVALFVLSFIFKTGLILFLYILGISVFVIFGAVGLGLVFGIYFARFDWIHPKQMLQSGGFIYLTIASVLFWLVSVQIIGSFAVHLPVVFFCVGVLGTVFYIIGTISAIKKFEKLEWT
ncbi:hypothetical protein JW935_10040 [candidate division KSB1 bacterium]|nr:hypothetical protein [candidate division KSB1 bacterium]